MNQQKIPDTYFYCYPAAIKKFRSILRYQKVVNGMHQIRSVNVVRYVTPLREGGSLPAIVECDDSYLYVLKFRGAGQGRKALIAELLGGEIARFLGFKVPEIVLADLDSAFGRIEGDEEIQDLLKASTGLNLGLHYLSGAITYDPVATKIDPYLASRIVWLDGLLMNMDRTCRNTNMLLWHKELWLIDHGASFYFHHSWDTATDASSRPFPMIKDHVFLQDASALDEANASLKPLLTNEVIHHIVSMLPSVWLEDETGSFSEEQQRKAYIEYLEKRVRNSDSFVKEAKDARK